MQVTVNYPKTEEELKVFNDRFALFHASLLIEKIKRLEIDTESKRKVLNGVIEKIKSNMNFYLN